MIFATARRSGLLASLIVAAAGATASGQTLTAYNRTISPEDITITAAPPQAGSTETGQIIKVRASAINRSTADLTSDIVVTQNGTALRLYRVIFVFPGEWLCTTGLSSCSGGQCFTGSSCRRDFSSGVCGCASYYDLVIPGTVTLAHGDVIGVTMLAAPGAAPEEYTADDSASITFQGGTPCAADFDQSGSISVQDLFDFFAAYFGGNPAADFNQSGSLSVQDIFDFLAAFFAGCP